MGCIGVCKLTALRARQSGSTPGDYLSNDHLIFLCLITEHITICNGRGGGSFTLHKKYRETV